MLSSGAPKNSIIERDLLEHAESAIMSQYQASNISLWICRSALIGDLA
jgi:hypothetical protein